MLTPNSNYKGIKKVLYGQLLQQQGGRCAICHLSVEEIINKKKQALIYSEGRNILLIDHCHKTGSIRGLLCENCNQGIGRLMDDPTVVQNALEYLESHHEKTLPS